MKEANMYASDFPTMNLSQSQLIWPFLFDLSWQETGNDPVLRDGVS